MSNFIKFSMMDIVVEFEVIGSPGKRSLVPIVRSFSPIRLKVSKAQFNLVGALK